jgi:hypothetical protein
VGNEVNMPQQFDWLRSKRLLRITLKGDLSKDEVLSLDTRVYEALEAEPNCEAVMFDITQATGVASHVYQSRIKRGYPPEHRLKYICIVGEHRLLRLMLLLGYSHTHASLQLFSSQAQAITFLRIPPGELDLMPPADRLTTPHSGIGA